jgi:tryptophan 2,3-dioxygenase
MFQHEGDVQMNQSEWRKWLRSWDTREFIREQRVCGRAKLPAETIAKYAQDHDTIADLLANDSLAANEVPLARLLEAITAPLAALHADRIPRYYSYTGVNVLDEYLDAERFDLDMQKRLCIEGIRGLLLELTRFEAHSLVRIEPWSKQTFDPDVCTRRLKLLHRQFSALDNLVAMLHVPNLDLDTQGPRSYDTLEGYCGEKHLLSAIVQFTCLPSSCSHDEVLFLRTIAEDELCFNAVYLATRQAGEAIERSLVDAAVFFLDQATAFVTLLHESFRVLQSMPPEHFVDFREVTGQASAVQSFNYQRLDAAVFGVSPEKITIFQRVPHLSSLIQFASKEFASLRSLLQSLPNNGMWERVIQSARHLDSHLLSWRGLHLSFALRYLPPEALGTGGTAGPSYLQKFFRQSLFMDTEPDFGLIEAIFGESSNIKEIFRARPGTRIAPAENLWIGQLPVEAS